MRYRSYDEVISRLESVARQPTISLQALGEFEAEGRSYPIYVVRIGEPGAGKRGVTISAGIHGDEPAGVEAALCFLETCASDEGLLSRFHFMVFPCDNPTGWEMNTRENAAGIDLNRQFAVPKPEPEVALIMRALQGECFDLVVEMHEDIDSPGFYLYELVEEHSQAVGERIVEAVEAMGCPINRSPEIEGLPASEGIIRPRSRRLGDTNLPKAVYTHRTCGGHVMTFEPPASVLPLDARVQIELEGLWIALDAAGDCTKGKE